MAGGLIIEKVNIIMNKLTVTIGIPAYNEEKNIGNLLNSLIIQNEDNYILESIIIVCDGCSDQTSSIVQNYYSKDGRVKLVNDGRRLGKSSRINQLFSKSISDILILIDGDVLIKDQKVISEIVREFRNKKVGLVGGCDIPSSPKSFQEKIVVSGIGLWFEVRKSVNKDDSIHNIHGSIYALSKKVYKKFHIPQQVINDDMYVYLKTRELGYRSSFSTRGIVYYQAPANLADFYKQTKRFSAGRFQIDQLFGKRIQKYFSIPRKAKILGTLSFLIKNPVEGLLAIPLQLSLTVVMPFIKKQYDENGVWRQIASTKTLVTL